MKNQKHILFLFIISLIFCQTCFADDLVLSGVYEAAIDLPRIYFLVKNHQPAKSDFEQHYAFLDTGASGILLSSETVESMRIGLEPNAQAVDAGVGGNEYFSVSKPIQICLAGLESPNAENPGSYKCFGPWRVQVRKSGAEMLSEPLDVIGMPAMVGNIVVLNSGATNSLSYFAAEVLKEKGPKIPRADFKVPLKLKKFANPNIPGTIPPFPVSASNAMIENISVAYNGKTSKANWILDTGATVSMISTRQAAKLGLTDASGNPLVKSSFSVPVGGIGKMSTIEGYEIEKLTIPAADGKNIVFKNARIGVHDVKYIDPETNKEVTIDGIFGSNFLCSSAKMEGMLPSDIGESPFDHIIIDLQENTLGFDIRNNSNTSTKSKLPRSINKNR